MVLGTLKFLHFALQVRIHPVVAVDDFERLLALFDVFRLLVLHVHAAAGDLDDFLRGLESKAGTSPFLRWYLADADYRASKWPGALAGFKAYADAYPNDPLGWQCLALVYPKVGRFDAAEEALDRALELGIDAERAADALRRLTAAVYAAKDYARIPLTATTVARAQESLPITLVPGTAPGPQTGQLTISWGTVHLTADWLVR